MPTDKFYDQIGIPKGYYCYTQFKPIYQTTKEGYKFVAGHYVKYCPFWYGSRPDGGCMIFGWDAALGDACKACGWNQPEGLPF